MSLEDVSVSKKGGSPLGRRKFVKTVAAIAGLGLTAEALAACGDNTATSTAAAPAAPPTAASTTAPAATTATSTTAAPTTAAATTATATTVSATTASATTSGAATTAASGSGAPDGYSMVGATSQYKADGDPVAFTVNTTQGFVFNKGGSFIAYSNVCTHKGCKVPYVAADQKLECPCHGSQYDKSGEVVKGPAPKRLPQFDTKVVGDTLYVKVS